jgi:hypothetical protein
MTDFRTAREFAQFIKGLGFRAFVAGNDGPRGYGFMTNADGSRVVSFQMDDGSLGGNYGPPSRACGTGWRMDETVWSIKTRADVQRVLDATPPWCPQAREGERDSGWRHMTTLEQHLGMYGSSSKYQEV